MNDRTRTAERETVQDAPREATSAGELVPMAPGGMKLRLAYPKNAGEYFGVDARMWGVLIDAIYPNAKTVEGICLALSYCKSRNLDIMKRPIHIVPMSVRDGTDDRGKPKYKETESVWPGICEVRITATRTGNYAGKDAAEFGPDVTKTFQYVDDRNDAVKKEKEVTFPEWCRVTVYKIVGGVRCAFVGPKVYWEEAYATESRWSQIPNEMWSDRRSGQLEKCGEAASLRAAFPEELGNDYTAEEMAGRVLDRIHEMPPAETDRLIPPRPRQSEFTREAKPNGGKAPAPPQAATAEPIEHESRATGAEKPEAASEAPKGSGEVADPKPYEQAVAFLARAAESVNSGEWPTLEELHSFRDTIRQAIGDLEGVTEMQTMHLRGQWNTVILLAERKLSK
jgi:phage recombination protein Bet